MVFKALIVILVLLFSKMNLSDCQPKKATPGSGSMATEADRIKNRIDSFEGWRGTKTPTQLAIAGFRYTGVSDKVICDTCGLKLFNWLEKDHPVESHKLYSPDCSFVKKWFSFQENSEENTNTQSPLPPPVYPNYATYQNRVDSFYGWPCRQEHQSPSSMAQQGFFYIGSADRVSCFQCGLRLRDWDDSDYPADCHREWSPDCPFINKSNSTSSNPRDESSSETSNEAGNLSEENAENAVLAEACRTTSNSEAASVVKESEETLSDNLQNHNATLLSGHTASSSSVVDQSDACHLNWSSPKVQAVLEMGCGRELIERVTSEHLRNTGIDFPSATVLYEAILAVESNTI